MESSTDHSRPPAEGAGALEAAPGLARIAAGAWLRTAGWTAGTAFRTTRRVAAATLGREPPGALVREAGEELVEGAGRLLRVAGIDRRLGALLPRGNGRREAPTLRDRGQELLTRSSELTEHGDAHPAYSRILDQISPDEARILRLLATGGPQPAIDVRTWRPLDIGSSVVAPGLSMISQHAGCMRADRVPAYLSNLFRLGLIWFSRESLPDPGPYQVLEAQPDAVDAARRAGRARIVRRSIDLTPFGRHFCDQCLPLETAEIPALPRA